MNKRQDKMLAFMKDGNSWITGKELAQLLGVSDRTIRKDIDTINKEYPQLVKSNIRHGYRIDIETLNQHKVKVDKMIPQTPLERSVYILKELLFNKSKINLLDIQDKVFVSEYSIDNDLKRIKSILKLYPSLRIEKKKNYITLIGTEGEKRRLYKELLSSETKGNFINMNAIAELYLEFDLIEVKDILEEIFTAYNFKIREDTFPMVMLHIGVALERMMQKNYIKTDYKSEDLQQLKEYKISNMFFQKISKKYLFEVNDDEIALIALLLLGRRSVPFTQKMVKEKSNINFEEILEKILMRIEEYFDIDFHKDEVFKLGMILHMQNLLDRILKKQLVNNLYLGEVKRKYPLIFEMGIFVGRVLEEAIEFEITEDEIGYLTLHLGAAYDRLDISDKYRVLLIHPNNQLLASICQRKLEERFKDKIIIEEVFNYFEESMITAINPDLIITTANLKHNLAIPTIQISLFVNSEDEYNVFQWIQRLDKKKTKKLFEGAINELITKDFFFKNLEANTPEEVINFMCDRANESKLVPPEYKESVLQREKISATSFSYGFAIPHSLNVSANKTSIGVAILKKEIEWGGEEVRLVILLALHEDNRKLLGTFFDWLGNVVSNPTMLSNLLETKNHEEFIRYILE